MRVVKVMSQTHYGRGTPPTNEKVRRLIEAAKQALDTVVPDLPLYGYCDEDYGWFCVIDTEQEQEILRRYPESFVELDNAYIHNDEAEFADMFRAPNGVDVMVVIRPLRQQEIGAPICRDFDSMYSDWFNNYGRY